MLFTPLQRRRLFSIFQRKRVIPCVCRRDTVPPEYAIREITLNASNSIVAITPKALSPKAASSAELAEAIRQLLARSELGPVECGETARSFNRAEIESWLACIGKPVLQVIEK
jgi:hypothetical protein